MNINFACSRCSQPLVTDEQFAGQTIECPTCKLRQEVPTALEAAARRHAAEAGSLGNDPTAIGNSMATRAGGAAAGGDGFRAEAGPVTAQNRQFAGRPTPRSHRPPPAGRPQPQQRSPAAPSRSGAARPSATSTRGGHSAHNSQHQQYQNPQQPPAAGPGSPQAYGYAYPGYNAAQPGAYGQYPPAAGYGYGYPQGYDPYGHYAYAYRYGYGLRLPEHPKGATILTLGILGVVLGLTCGVGVILGDIAFFMALSARGEIRSGQYRSSGNVTAGFVLGIISLVLTGLFLLALVAG